MKIGYDAKRIFHNASGLGNYSRDLVRILATYYPKNSYHLYNPKKQKLNRWKPLPNTIEKQPKGIWRYFHSLWRQGPIVRQLKNDGIDVFHGLSGELPKGLRIPSIVTVHDLIFVHYPELYNPIDVYIHKRKVKHAVKKATKVVAISEQTKADLIRFTGVAEHKISVIYQGCHHAFKNKFSKEKRAEIRKTFGLPEKFVLYVGTLEERKNALSIAKALKDSNHHMVFVGKAKAYGKKLKTFVLEHQLQDRVVFIDQISIEELAGVYQCATVFCYPSFYEGFGIPIIEALYSGVPVITSKGGCFSEAGGVSSVYIDPKDKKQLQEAIEELFAESYTLRKKRIAEGLVHVQKFNDDVIAAHWDTQYTLIVQKQ